jgi:outer membrane protein OmpA-like peptidoglycan-associated protein
MKGLTSTGLLAALFLGACTPAAQSQQLVDARRSFQVAESGHASDYAPDELHEARKLMEQAEAQKDGSPEEMQLAYLADRQARLAKADGTREYYLKQKADSQQTFLDLQSQGKEDAQAALVATRARLEEVSRSLQNKDANVEELEKQRLALESEQARLETALGVSEKKRTEAEERADQAMASLKELALVKEAPQETRITLSGSVLFKTGEAELLPIAENTLGKVADAIQGTGPESKVVIEGYTDSVGTDSNNKALSQKRADAVRTFLISRGVAEARLKAVGRGEEGPVADNNTPEGRANNRRVELVIEKSPQATAATPASGSTVGSSGAKTGGI